MKQRLLVFYPWKAVWLQAPVDGRGKVRSKISKTLNSEMRHSAEARAQGSHELAVLIQAVFSVFMLL